MKQFKHLVMLCAILAFTATGFAGIQCADTGPPATNKHFIKVSVPQFEVINQDVNLDVANAMVSEDISFAKVTDKELLRPVVHLAEPMWITVNNHSRSWRQTDMVCYRSTHRKPPEYSKRLLT